jgi:ABC-type transport system involved in multi-copper enzyme maturation permease subunit
LGRFLGLALFLILTSTILGGVAGVVIKIASGIYPSDRPIIWNLFVLAIVFATLKYILLIAVAMLLSTVSTSFFLPIFGTICVFLASGITQQVYEYVHSPVSAQTVSPFLRSVSSLIYYILPNLAGFDLKVNAIYSIPPHLPGLGLTLVYFIVYTAALLGGSALLLNRREIG